MVAQLPVDGASRPGNRATGRKTAISAIEIAMTAHDLAVVCSPPPGRRARFVHDPLDVLDHDDGVVDDQAGRERQANRVSVLIEKPKSCTRGEVPISDTGRVRAVTSTA